MKHTTLFPTLFLLLGLSITGLAQAPTFTYQGYNWEPNRKQMAISKEDEQAPAVMLKLLQAHEYVYENNKQTLVIYSTEHKITRVNTDEAIERNNKIYIPTAGVLELVELKARAISPRGQVTELNKSNIKEVKDEDGNRSYKIFAVEGVEKGSEIEYICTRKRNANFFGRDFLQSAVPVRDARYELISPENLQFALKGYNGFPEAKEQVQNEKRTLSASLAYIPSLVEEPFAYYNPNRMRAEYKLAYNTAQGRNRLFTWSDAAKRVHESIYSVSKEETKALQKLFKGLKLPAAATPEEKITRIENYLKTSFEVQEGNTDALENIAAIEANKYASSRGMVRLFAGMFKQAGIDHELVITTERDNIRFDDTFESWNYLDQFAFYFPATQKFLSPDHPEYRYGMIPFDQTSNQGLFIKEVQVGTTSSAVGVTRFIPTLPAATNFNDLDITVNLTPAMDQASLRILQTFGGYSATFLQPYYTFIPEVKRKEILEGMVKSIVSDAEFTTLTVENGEVNRSLLSSPFKIDASLRSAALIEKAGNKYLIKFGELLGPQSELYQERERKLDVENTFNRSYTRVLKMEVPAGFVLRNPDDLKRNVHYSPNGNKLYAFESTYQLQNNLLTVNVVEYYKELNCGRENFEDFRRVINAAADFNKIMLVLEKTGQ